MGKLLGGTPRYKITDIAGDSLHPIMHTKNAHNHMYTSKYQQLHHMVPEITVKYKQVDHKIVLQRCKVFTLCLR